MPTCNARLGPQCPITLLGQLCEVQGIDPASTVDSVSARPTKTPRIKCVRLHSTVRDCLPRFARLVVAMGPKTSLCGALHASGGAGSTPAQPACHLHWRDVGPPQAVGNLAQHTHTRSSATHRGLARPALPDAMHTAKPSIDHARTRSRTSQVDVHSHGRTHALKTHAGLATTTGRRIVRPTWSIRAQGAFRSTACRCSIEFQSSSG